jgi:hypothetical protein
MRQVVVEKSQFCSHFSLLLEQEIFHSMKINDPNSVFARFSPHMFPYMYLILSLIDGIAVDDTLSSEERGVYLLLLCFLLLCFFAFLLFSSKFLLFAFLEQNARDFSLNGTDFIAKNENMNLKKICNTFAHSLNLQIDYEFYVRTRVRKKNLKCTYLTPKKDDSLIRAVMKPWQAFSGLLEKSFSYIFSCFCAAAVFFMKATHQ